MKGEAQVQYNSDTVRFATFGFPGLYYPGLLTVGPSLALEGYSECGFLHSCSEIIRLEMQSPDNSVYKRASRDKYLSGFSATLLTLYHRELTTGLSYQFPPLHYSLGKTGDDDIGPNVVPRFVITFIAVCLIDR